MRCDVLPLTRVLGETMIKAPSHLPGCRHPRMLVRLNQRLDQHHGGRTGARRIEHGTKEIGQILSNVSAGGLHRNRRYW